MLGRQGVLERVLARSGTGLWCSNEREFNGDSICLSLESYIEADEDYMVEALRIDLSVCVLIKSGVACQYV